MANSSNTPKGHATRTSCRNPPTQSDSAILQQILTRMVVQSPEEAEQTGTRFGLVGWSSSTVAYSAAILAGTRGIARETVISALLDLYSHSPAHQGRAVSRKLVEIGVVASPAEQGYRVRQQG